VIHCLAKGLGSGGDYTPALSPLSEEWRGSYSVNGTSGEWWYDQNWTPQAHVSLEAMIYRARPKAVAYKKAYLLAALA